MRGASGCTERPPTQGASHAMDGDSVISHIRARLRSTALLGLAAIVVGLTAAPAAPGGRPPPPPRAAGPGRRPPAPPALRRRVARDAAGAVDRGGQLGHGSLWRPGDH